MTQIETLTAVIRADAFHFNTGMADAQASLKRLEQGLTATGPGLNRVKGAMSALAFQAAGVPGPIGRIVDGMLLLGGGSGLVVGVAAVLGTLTLAYKALTDAAREAAKVQAEFVKNLAGVGPHAEATALRMQIATQQSEIQALEDARAGRLGPVRQKQFSAAGFVEEIEKRQRRIAELQIQMADAQRRAAEAANEHHAALKKISDELARQAEIMRVMDLQSVFEAQQRIKLAAGRVELRGAGPGDARGVEQTPEGERIARQMREVLDPTDLFAETEERLKRLGVSLGRQFMFGLIEGIESMQDVLRSVFMAVLDFAFGSILGGLLGGLAGAGAGIAGLSKSIRKPAGSVQGAALAPAIDFSRFPPAMDPLSAGRDAQWQRFLRDSMSYAHHSGYRG